VTLDSRVPRRRTWTALGVVLATAVVTAAVAVSLAGGAQASPATVANTVSLRQSDVEALPKLSVKLANRSTSHTNLLLSGCSGEDSGGISASLVVAQTYDVQSAPVQQESVTSVVIVKSSPAAAARDLAVYRTPAYEHCEAQAFAKRNSQGGTVTRAQATPLPVTVPGSDGGFGLREALTIRTKAFAGGKGSLVADLRGFVLGRYEVVLLVFGSGSGQAIPFPANIEQPLLSSLLARARAQPH